MFAFAWFSGALVVFGSLVVASVFNRLKGPLVAIQWPLVAINGPSNATNGYLAINGN